MITHRNDVPEWSLDFRGLLESLHREHVTLRIPLHRLSDDNVREIIERRTGRQAAPSLIRLMVRHTEGNPLFVVEMLKHLEEIGALAGRENWNPPIALIDVGLPGRNPSTHRVPAGATRCPHPASSHDRRRDGP